MCIRRSTTARRWTSRSASSCGPSSPRHRCRGRRRPALPGGLRRGVPQVGHLSADLRTLSEDSLMWRTPDNDEMRPSQALQTASSACAITRRSSCSRKDEPESRERTFELQYDLRRSLHGWLRSALREPPAGKSDASSSRGSPELVRSAHRPVPAPASPDGYIDPQFLVGILQNAASRSIPNARGRAHAVRRRLHAGGGPPPVRIRYCIRKNVLEHARIERSRRFARRGRRVRGHLLRIADPLSDASPSPRCTGGRRRSDGQAWRKSGRKETPNERVGKRGVGSQAARPWSREPPPRDSHQLPAVRVRMYRQGLAIASSSRSTWRRRGAHADRLRHARATTTGVTMASVVGTSAAPRRSPALVVRHPRAQGPCVAFGSEKAAFDEMDVDQVWLA